MYESFYGLKEKTFNLSPDPEYFYMSREHEHVYTHLEYAISENKGFAVVTGEIGAGKTTLINYLLYKTQLDIQIGLINNTNIPASQFLRAVCSEFEIEIDTENKVDLMEVFQNFLLKQYAENNRVLLIIDEAQNLSPKIMEEIRMISNLEAEKSHLIQMILVGQPELRLKLQRADLKQFAQRVSVYCHLEGLSRDEVGDYIRYRLQTGKAENVDLFEENAIDLIYNHSKGIPRIINIICDTALVYGYAEGHTTITKRLIEEVIDEREQSGIFKEFEKDGLLIPVQKDQRAARTENYASNMQIMEAKVALLEANLNRLQDAVDDLKSIKNERDHIVVDLFKMLEDSLKKRTRLLTLVGRLARNKKDAPKGDIEEQLKKISLVKE